MARTLSERVKDPIYWVEQALHLALGGAISYAFSDMGGWGSFGFSAFLGLLRELIQNLRFKGWRPRWDGSLADAGIDMLAWTVGAIVGSVVA
jgi:hypothetical protein